MWLPSGVAVLARETHALACVLRLAGKPHGDVEPIIITLKEY